MGWKKKPDASNANANTNALRSDSTQEKGATTEVSEKVAANTAQSDRRANAGAAQSERRTKQTATASIGAAVHIQGKLSGKEDVRIDGSITGEVVFVDHAVTISAGARVDAEITAKAVVVHGTVVGNVTASKVISVSKTGSVEGDLRAPSIALVEGARVQGRIEMSTTESPRPTAGASEPRDNAPAKQTETTRSPSAKPAAEPAKQPVTP